MSGNENVGCLGLGDSITEALEPRFVQSMRVRRVVQLACGWRMTIAITDDHRIFAWGLIGSLVSGTGISGLYEKDTTHVISTSPCEINNFEKSTSIACFVDVSFSHTLSATGIILRNKALKASSASKNPVLHPQDLLMLYETCSKLWQNLLNLPKCLQSSVR